MKKPFVFLLLLLVVATVSACKPIKFSDDSYRLAKSALEVGEKFSSLDVTAEDALLRLEDIDDQMSSLYDIEDAFDSQYSAATLSLHSLVSSLVYDVKMYTANEPTGKFDEHLHKLKSEINSGSYANVEYIPHETLGPKEYDEVILLAMQGLDIADDFLNETNSSSPSLDELNIYIDKINDIYSKLHSLSKINRDRFTIDSLARILSIYSEMRVSLIETENDTPPEYRFTLPQLKKDVASFRDDILIASSNK